MDEYAREVEKQMQDSDMIFNTITSGNLETFDDAQRVVVMGYALDKSISRAGISHALKRLEQFYKHKK